MAIIIATIDTEAESLTVTVNGSAVPDVSDVSMYSCEDYDGDIHTYVSVGTMTKDDSGLIKRTYISKAGVTEEEPAELRDPLVAKAMADFREYLK